MASLCNLKICSINIDGLSPKSLMCLDKYNDEEKFDLIKVQETGKREDVNLCNMKYIRDENKARNRGSIVYIRDCHSLSKLKSLNNLSNQIDTAWGIAVIHSKRYIVSSVYLKHNYIEGIKDLNNMLKEAYQLQPKLKASGIIVSGDFNARHTIWGDRVSDSYGKTLVQQLDFEKFSIHSSNSPTFLADKGNSAIDFFIISNNLDVENITCTTDNEVYLGSGAPFRGHLPVIANISFKHKPTPKHKKRKEVINIDNVDWEKWSQDVEHNLMLEECEIENSDDPYRLWQILNTSIQSATMKHAEKKISTPYSKPYWTNELTYLAKTLRLARKAYNKRNTDSNKDKLKAAKSEFDEKRKKACSDFIMDRAKNLNSVQAQKFWKKFNALFKKKSDQYVEPLFDKNGILISENEEIEKEMFSTFFEGKHLRMENFDDEFFNEIDVIYHNILSELDEASMQDSAQPAHLNRRITLKEITDVIKNQQAGVKSLDRDNFHPKMFKHLSNKAMKLMCKVFNTCFSTGSWVWEESDVIFLKKDGKDTYASPGSYRPISITSYIGKLLEKILVNRIHKHQLIEMLYDEDQEGFFQLRNTIRYLNRLNLGIKQDIAKNYTSIGLFIDLEKAFDSVWKQGLIVKLYNIGITGNMLKIINTFLINKKISLSVNGFKGPLRNGGDVGVPQGSVLSPVLFKIYLMDFGKELENIEGIAKLKFADDGTIKVSKQDTPDCLRTMENVLQVMKNWCQKWRMVINCSPNKTEIICFHTAEGDKSLIPQSFKLGHDDVKVVNKTKVLGLIVDEDLNFKAHSEYIYNRLVTKWVLVSKYSNKNWGFSQRVMTQLLKTIFLSIIYYAGHLWITRKNLQEIDKLWYKMTKSTIGAVFNISQTVSSLILGIPPLEVTNQINKIKHYLKLNLNNSDYDPLTKFISSTLHGHDNMKVSNELNTTMKEVFHFLNWRLEYGNHKMNDKDIKIITDHTHHDFFELSQAACKYTKSIVTKYIEFRWSKSVRNIYSQAGENIIPTPSCKPLPMPPQISRKSEVILMSMFYENNLMNDFLWRRSLTASPLCSLCHIELQTPYHAIIQCTAIDLQLRTQVKTALTKVVGEQKSQLESSTTLLNASRSQEFIEAAVKIVQNYNFRHEIILNAQEEH